MTGRPTKLTPETQRAIVDGITVGMVYELAAQLGGVSYDSFNEWMKRGERERARIANGGQPKDAETPFLDFSNAVKKAEAQAAARWLLRIDQAANDGEWQAAAWKLERRYPKLYGRRVVENTGPDGGALPVQIEIVRRKDEAGSQAPD